MPLCQALFESDDDVREEAAWALGEIGSAVAVGPLCQALHDTSPGACWRVEEALGRIGCGWSLLRSR